MKCEHCGYAFDTVALKAKQGTQTLCPSCGKMTGVHYSFADSLKDFHGVMVRDPKYISRPLRVISFIVLAIFVLVSIILICRNS